MENLKVCFVGVGSIAKRHIRNLKLVCEKKDITLQIDVIRHSKESGELENDIKDIINKIYFSIDSVPSDYDVAFITNPTRCHADTLKAFNHKAKNFFIEKPVTSVETMNELENFKINKNSIYYVACPLRYSSVIQYIKKSIDINDVISIRSICSSYLPEWRPYCDYRQTYSAQKALGGGVSIDLIHEWDYLAYLFGMPLNINFMSGKKSDLDIDSDDYAIYIAEFQNSIAELHLDYFGRTSMREIMLFTKEETIVGDLNKGKISFLNTQKVIDFAEQRDDYQIKELEHFINLVEGKEKQDKSDIEHAMKVLKLTQGEV